jgi:hypothetical protein
MNYIFLLSVLIVSTAFCFGQTDPKPKQYTRKEFEELVKKASDERKEMEELVRRAYEERDRALSKPQVIYYAPVIQPSAERIAYVKRTVEYRLKGGGFIPFLSDSPEVTWISDLIELCERDLASGTEMVISRWALPKPSRSELGVFPYLDWTDKLDYDIRLSAYDERNIPEGATYSGGEIRLSNDPSLLRNGNTTARGVTVGLDVDPWPYRYPASNKILITCEKSRQTCPRF